MEEQKKANGNGEKPPEINIQSTTSLGILIIVFLAIFLMTLFVIMTGKAHPEGFGRESFGPADFPEIFGGNPIAELASFSGKAIIASATNPEESGSFNVPRPPLSEGIFPCSSCHEGIEPNETIRTVEAHPDIVLKHGNPQERWCLDCHNAKNRDVLRLASGKTIPFEESYRLCGQCHGNIYRDWKLGIHGKRVGFWNGPKIYLLCVNCHNPHSPRFKPIPPLPPPVRPEFQFTHSGEKSLLRPGSSSASIGAHPGPGTTQPSPAKIEPTISGTISGTASGTSPGSVPGSVPGSASQTSGGKN